jgi:hypothetical protein
MKKPPPINIPEGGKPARRLDFVFHTVLAVPLEAWVKVEQKEAGEGKEVVREESELTEC